MNRSTIGIAQLVRRATFIVFACAIIVGSIIFYLFFSAASMRHIADEAGALMSAATAVRAYTADQITPLVDRTFDGEFNPETVPSYAAQTVFKKLSGDLDDYTYREASLNPTNVNDIASAFEAGLIQQFEQDRSLTELSAIRRTDDDAQFYIARPIVMESNSCLTCHSTPEVAPKSMIDAYGSQNGFGWELGSVVAIQLLTIPVDDELTVIYELVAIFFGMLLVLFVLVSIAVMLPLQRDMIKPLQQLAQLADRSSLRDDNFHLPENGTDEIRALSSAINRLRTSLHISLAKSEQSEVQDSETSSPGQGK